MRRWSAFPSLFGLMIVLSVAFLSGCAHDVKTNTPQQAVFLAGADVGAALIAADTYQALNDCDAAGHTMPCSTKANNAKVQKAKESLLTARNKARDLVRTPGFDQSQLSTWEAEMQAAIEVINAIVGNPQASILPALGVQIVTAAAVLGVLGEGTAAAKYLQLLLYLLGLAKTIFGAGSKMHTFTSAIEDQVRNMIADNNRNPTDPEWAAQDEQLNELVKQPPQAEPGSAAGS